MVVASVINRLNTIKNAKILGCFIKSNQNGTSILMHHNKNDAKYLKQIIYSDQLEKRLSGWRYSFSMLYCSRVSNQIVKMLKLNTYIQYFEIKLILSINVSSLSLFENFNGTTGRDGFPGKRQKLVPGQTFGKEREIAVTISKQPHL